MLEKNRHGKALEAGTVYLKVDKIQSPVKFSELKTFYTSNKYSKVFCFNDIDLFVSTNYRVVVENDRLADLNFLCEPDSSWPKDMLRVCIHFTCDRGVSAEANRHTVNSAMESSTRYINYSKGKFGNQISVIVPDDIDMSQTDLPNHDMSTIFRELANTNGSQLSIPDWWWINNKVSEMAYMNLLKLGWKPEQARRVLPLDLHTELTHTAFVEDWKHFFDLRCDKAAHPDMRKVAEQAKELMIKEGYIDNND